MKTLITLALLLLAALPLSAEDKGLQKEWTALKPAYEKKDGKLNPKAEVKEDSILLQNRGGVKSTKQYQDGCELSFVWKPSSEDTKGSYKNLLTVALWTTGEQAKYPSEFTQGVCVRFDPNGGTIKIEQRTSATETKELAKKENVKMEMGKEYPVTIVAKKNGDVNVAFAGDVKVEAKATANKDAYAAFADRESVADVVKETTLTKVKITDLKKK